MRFFKDFVKDFFLLFKPYYKYIRFVIVFLIFFTFSIFKSIPIFLFKLNVETLSVNAKYLLSLFEIILALIFSSLFYIKELKGAFINFKKNMKVNFKSKTFLTFKIWLLGTIIMFASNFLISSTGIGTAVNDTNVTNNLFASPIIFGSIVLFFQPILEEITFRLAFKDIFKNKWIFILLSGIIFGSIHVVFSLNDLSQLLFLIPYCSLGIAFGYIYYNTDNIIYPISIHIFHNILALILTFLSAGV